MSERNHYDAGAIHNDHHKEINIGTVSESVLKDLISNFFKDDAEDADVVEEVSEVKTEDDVDAGSEEATEVLEPDCPKEIDTSEEDEEPELNYATPRIVLQNMLKAEKVRPAFNNPKKYNKEWTDQFIASLMASKHGAYIAKKWEENDQRNLLKGYVFGMLAESGVLKGSKLSIARAYLEISSKSKVPELVKQVNTFASYMSKSRWKNEPFADWVLEYVGEPQEEA